MNKLFTHICDKIAKFLGKPYVFVVNVLVVIACSVICLRSPDSAFMLVFNTGLSIFSYLILFIIQNTQNRDGAVIQAKLNEIIHSIDKANDKLIGYENKTIEELQEFITQSQLTDT